MGKASSRGRIDLIPEDITSLAEEFKPLGLGDHDRMFCQLIFQVACSRIQSYLASQSASFCKPFVKEEKRACLYSVRPFVSVIPIQA